MRTAMIADIIQSKQIDNRKLVQVKLVELLDILNNVFKDRLVRSVEIRDGDSLKGVFDKPSDAFLYIRMVQMVMYPIKIRVGLGYGPLAYELDDYSSDLLDGPAFHYARFAIEKISGSPLESIMFCSSGKEKFRDSDINAYFDMYIRIRQRFGAKMFHIIMINEILNPMSMDGILSYRSEAADLSKLILISKTLNEKIMIVKKHYSLDKDGLVYNEEGEYELNSREINSLNRGGFSINTIFSSNQISYSGSDFVRRGIQEDISSIVNTSRQNIQRYFSNGVMDERYYSASVCRIMDDISYE